ncbi:hypothetical protein IIU_06131 [Bacillus cereus VD133]|uniref:Major facilitator superfamily (MFS) profile domain-containing protein n=1 Tax=Bacillus cereus VD133 TaxID=1053233 RepID=A0A9W5PKW3_BACCE|nr:hypothetical protein IIU_06131 [Bacillus cereus VD133]
MIDGRLRTLTLISLAGFAGGSIILGISNEVALLIYIGIAIWGITFGRSATLLQTAIADAAGDGADVAQSMFVTVFNLAVSGGGIVGGALRGRIFPLVTCTTKPDRFSRCMGK